MGKQSQLNFSQVAIILFFLLAGEGISLLIDGFIPGSVIGMLLLFASLCFGIIKLRQVQGLAHLLTKNMVILFVPASVGLMTATQFIADEWLFLLLSTFGGTFLVITIVGLLQQWLGKEVEDVD